MRNLRDNHGTMSSFQAARDVDVVFLDHIAATLNLDAPASCMELVFEQVRAQGWARRAGCDLSATLLCTMLGLRSLRDEEWIDGMMTCDFPPPRHLPIGASTPWVFIAATASQVHVIPESHQAARVRSGGVWRIVSDTVKPCVISLEPNDVFIAASTLVWHIAHVTEDVASYVYSQSPPAPALPLLELRWECDESICGYKRRRTSLTS